MFSQRAQRNAEGRRDDNESGIKKVSALSAFLCALCENLVLHMPKQRQIFKGHSYF